MHFTTTETQFVLVHFRRQRINLNNSVVNREYSLYRVHDYTQAELNVHKELIKYEKSEIALLDGIIDKIENDINHDLSNFLKIVPPIGLDLNL